MLKSVFNRIFPLSCLLCRALSNQEVPLCRYCQQTLPWNKMANPLSNTVIPYTFTDNCIVTFYYQPPINHWISGLKFNKTLYFAKLLGHLITERVKRETVLPEVIIPIPLHWRRLSYRGFNQSLEILKFVSRDTHIPIRVSAIQRVRQTNPQVLLNQQDRGKNIVGAFACRRPIREKHVALFDDVITTGNTINTACQVLTKQGVEKITIWCCAKSTQKNRKSRSG